MNWIYLTPIPPELEYPLYVLLAVVSGFLIMFGLRKWAAAVWIFIVVSLAAPVVLGPILEQVLGVVPLWAIFASVFIAGGIVFVKIGNFFRGKNKR